MGKRGEDININRRGQHLYILSNSTYQRRLSSMSLWCAVCKEKKEDTFICNIYRSAYFFGFNFSYHLWPTIV